MSIPKISLGGIWALTHLSSPETSFSDVNHFDEGICPLTKCNEIYRDSISFIWVLMGKVVGGDNSSSTVSCSCIVILLVVFMLNRSKYTTSTSIQEEYWSIPILRTLNTDRRSFFTWQNITNVSCSPWETWLCVKCSLDKWSLVSQLTHLFHLGEALLSNPLERA